MKKIETLLDRFAFVANKPSAVMKVYLEEGKKIVGCFPVYTPQPLITASGMIPMGIWGGQITPTVAGKYNPIFTCSIMRSCLEYGMTGVYKGMSAVMMPMLCDTFRGMSSSWRAGVKEIPLIAFIHPQNRLDSGALDFMIEEYKSVLKRLEALSGVQVTNASLNAAIDLYNRKNAVMQTFNEVANDHLDIITPTVRHHVMKSATFLEVSETIQLVGELIALLKAQPIHKWTGHKLILTGITAEPEALLSLFEENKIAVVGDDLAQESRQYRTAYPAGEMAFERLASQWLNIKGCSMAYEEDSQSRGKMLVDMAKKQDADCIAVCLMRFCDVEEYDYPYISKATENAGLYSLCLEIDQSTQDNGQSRTKIQSYAEMAASLV
ncbi:2-hydroxyacyl-CoA dehydratase subunit D [Fusibacter ferrireducens]|uniref:2-hydroxyacyl-CoA dehydratase n=1 Tax=Fusibacter ferrireducens TaxID=2785058 RepID=A0ABR9ZYM4_9FIRM|nr:2-hydroxyacyl-CoA dehydratase family protein [Fusibacter ferrireducens]MBF4695056.1 2-hydroxyacyl-CoA dehydratase [Fusibacter ferrireducens]